MVTIMTFAYDIRSNLTMLVDLLNTAGTIAEAGDELTTTANLHDFASRHDFSGPLRATKSDVEETRRLRDRFDAAFAAGLDPEVDSDREALEERIVAEVNLALR
ncbi:zf-CGNR multi-domain protein, partial [Burkholderia multivorans]